MYCVPIYTSTTWAGTPQLIDEEWVPTFTNARYLIGETEWNYWDAHEDESTYGPVLADSVRPVVEAGLVDLAGD